MVVYHNRQGTGLFIVFKYIDEKLDTGSHTGTYARKPPARTYNTRGQAKAQWQRFVKDGYGARAAEITWDPETDEFGIEMIDEDWVPTIDRCRHRSRVPTEKNPWHYDECQRRKGHDGIHWAGKEAKKDPDFNPEERLKEMAW